MVFPYSCLGQRRHFPSPGSASPRVSSRQSRAACKYASRCPGSFGTKTCQRQNRSQLLQNCIFTCFWGVRSSYLGGNYSECCLEAVCPQNQTFLSFASSPVISFTALPRIHPLIIGKVTDLILSAFDTRSRSHGGSDETPMWVACWIR